MLNFRTFLSDAFSATYNVNNNIINSVDNSSATLDDASATLDNSSTAIGMSVEKTKCMVNKVKIDETSVNKLVGDKTNISKDEFVVFGQEHCKYKEVGYALENSGHKVKFWNHLDLLNEQNGVKKVEEVLNHSSDVKVLIKNICQNDVVNNALENLQRKENSEPMRMHLFIIDSDENTHSVMSAEDAISKRREDVTSAEMRRAAKLQKIPELETIVTDTIKCAKTGKNRSGDITVDEIVCPFKDPKWPIEEQKRNMQKELIINVNKQSKQKSQWKEQTEMNIDLIKKNGKNQNL